MLKGNLIRIAVVDDDEDDFFIISDYIKAIEGARLQVEWVNDYATALNRIHEKAYSIYFVDYRLGSQTGLNLLQEAMRIGSDAPIVLLTGKGSRSIDVQAMQHGATDYLVKSELNTEKLERCMRYALDRAENLKEVKRRENKYRNLFEGSKDAVFIADRQFVLLELNRAASNLLGAAKDELVGSNLLDFVRDAPLRKQLRQLLEQASDVEDFELEIQGHNNESIPCLLSISFLENLEGNHIVHGILHDITNLKKAQVANLQAQKLAANERLMRTLAHEIRNPLNNISLSIDHLETPFQDSDHDHLIEIMKRNCIRINHIITELLDLTKPSELVFQRCSLQEIMDESVAMISDRINLQKIQVKKEYPDSPLMILANKSKLNIAFNNILINAIEAMETNKGELTISMNNGGEFCQVSIRDNGTGIPEEYLPKLFEPFFTLKKNGVGLGLAASYSIIQSHKAEMQIESEIKKGTNFIISFRKSDTEPVEENAV
jgi:two-component system, sporulation sensor kinase E